MLINKEEIINNINNVLNRNEGVCKENEFALKALCDLYNNYKDDEYKECLVSYLDRFVDEAGNTIGLMNEDGSVRLEAVKASTALFTAFAISKNDKFKKAIDKVIEAINDYNKDNEASIDNSIMLQEYFMEHDTKFGGKEHYNYIISRFKKCNSNVEMCDLATIAEYMMALINTMSVMDQPIYEYYRELGFMYKDALKYAIGKGILEVDDYVVKGMVAYSMLKACSMKVILSEKYYETAESLIDWNGFEPKEEITAINAMAYAWC